MMEDDGIMMEDVLTISKHKLENALEFMNSTVFIRVFFYLKYFTRYLYLKMTKIDIKVFDAKHNICYVERYAEILAKVGFEKTNALSAVLSSLH